MNRKSAEKRCRLNLWILYTAAYLALAIGIVFLFLSKGRSLVYHSDAWRQHLRALSFYGKWLRGILYHLFAEHSFEIQSWSFGLGYGADIPATLHYYCIGEPLTALSVFVPEKYTKYFFEFLILLRPYLAGLSFLAYTDNIMRFRLSFPQGRCGKAAENSGRRLMLYTAALAAGALCYSFCGTVLYLGLLHPFFVTPMIWLPLLLLGAERVLRERRPLFFMAIVCLSALSNFYFFYMLVIFTAGYVLVRVLSGAGREKPEKSVCTAGEGALPGGSGRKARGERRREQLRGSLGILLRFLLYGAAGTAGAGAILVPVAIQFLNNPRSATQHQIGLFYEPAYYRQLLKNLVTFLNHPLYDTELCVGAVSAAALVLLFLMRGHRQLKLAAVCAALMLLFPFAGYVMNGFSYVINRWTFAAEFLAALILTSVIIDIGEGRACWLWNRPEEKSPAGEQRHGGRLRAFLCILMAAGAPVSAAVNIVSAYSSFPDEFVRRQSPEEYLSASYDNEAAAITAEAGGGSFWRYSGRDLTWNAALPEGTSSTQFCWSLANGNVSEFFQAVGNRDEQNFAYFALDDRIALQALAGVKYYLLSQYDQTYEGRHGLYGYTDEGMIPKNAGIPGGGSAASGENRSSGEMLDSWESGTDEVHVFENQFALPVGFTFDRTMSRSSFDALSMTERQEALLQAAVTEDRESGAAGDGEGKAGAEEGNLPVFSEKEMDYQETDGNGVISVKENDGSVRFLVKEGGASVTFDFAGLENSETYLVIEGLEADGPEPAGQLPIRFAGSCGGEEMTEKTLNYLTPKSQYYSGWHDFAINLGYSSRPVTSAVMTFPSPGLYRADSLRVVCQPAVPLMSFVPFRMQGGMENADLHKNPVSHADNLITGTVMIPEHDASDRSGISGQKFLMFSIPYSSGWSCFVDGEKRDLIKADVMYMGLWLDAGEHTVRLVYHTPGGRMGVLLSAAGILLMAVLAGSASGRRRAPGKEETAGKQ